MSRPPLEASLRAARDAGRKLLVPYVTGGLGDDWLDVVRAVADAGADAIEIGIPFSDPVMDGPTIQEASERALARRRDADGRPRRRRRPRRRGPPRGDDVLQPRVPRGARAVRAVARASSGVGGCILPDLPLEEVGAVVRGGRRRRMSRRCCSPRRPRPTTGFLGSVHRARGLRLRRRAPRSHRRACDARRVDDGDGQAAEGGHRQARDRRASASRPPTRPRRRARRPTAWSMASAIVRLLLDGGGPDEAGAFVADVRAAIDACDRGTLTRVA